jgi:hypothetical protein
MAAATPDQAPAQASMIVPPLVHSLRWRKARQARSNIEASRDTVYRGSGAGANMTTFKTRAHHTYLEHVFGACHNFFSNCLARGIAV